MKSLPWFSASLSLLICFALIGVVPACAQTGGGVVVGNAASAGFATVTTHVSQSPLTGTPFSADVINEFTQVLADGNRIHRETHGKIFRDSEGRTRNETESELPGRGVKQMHVTIMDPTQSVFISLFSQVKTANVHHFKQPSLPPSDGVVNKQPATTPATLQQQPTMKREELGTKEIEGLTATGTRLSITKGVGTIGNENPLTSVYETWFSQDLHTELLSIVDDPATGQRIKRLTNIHTGEPDPLLFQVPPDYKVKENP